MKYLSLMLLPLMGIYLSSCEGEKISIGGSGLIEATEVTISAETAGQLKALHFDEGDEAKQGDTIGLIDTATATLRLDEALASLKAAQTRIVATQIGIEQAEYNYGLAKKEFDRVSELIKSGSTNQQQYDQVETAYNQAALAKKQSAAAYQSAQADLERISSSLDLFRKQFHDCFPLSPVSGTVVDKYVEMGELIVLGKPLLKIARLDTVWTKIYLSPSDLTRIKLGGMAKIDPEDGKGSLMDGRISWISDMAEFTPKNVQTKEARADLVYAVKIVIPNIDRRLKIGMPVSIEII